MFYWGDLVHFLMSIKVSYVEGIFRWHQKLRDWSSVLRTFVIAGMQTTSSAMSRTLHLLSINPDVQTRLRNEIREAQRDGQLTYDQLVSLPYLDAVCRETLRLCVFDPCSCCYPTGDPNYPRYPPVNIPATRTYVNSWGMVFIVDTPVVELAKIRYFLSLSLSLAWTAKKSRKSWYRKGQISSYLFGAQTPILIYGERMPMSGDLNDGFRNFPKRCWRLICLVSILTCGFLDLQNWYCADFWVI